MPVAVVARRKAEADGGRVGCELVAAEVDGYRDDLARCRRLAELDGVGVADGVALEHGGAIAGLADDQGRLVVVDDVDEHVLDGEAVDRLVLADHRVADGNRQRAFLGAVADGLDVDLRARGPVGGIERDGQRLVPVVIIAGERDEDRLATNAAQRGRSLSGGDGDIGVVRVEAAGQRQVIAVLVLRVARVGVFTDLDPIIEIERRRGVALGGEVDAAHEQAQIGRIERIDRVADDPHLAFGALRHHRHDDVAADIDRIAAETADDCGDDVLVGRQHVERVIALEAVDFERFGAGDADRETRAVDAVLGDDEHVVELGAEHHDLVEARAAVDVDGRIDVVLDHVVIGTAIDLDVDPLGQGEGADDEDVVAVLALEAKVGMVRVDNEIVVAFTAIHHRRQRDAVGEVAKRRLDGLEGVFERRNGALVARRREQLADLEVVVALAAIQRQDRVVVVDEEGVVAVIAVDDDAAIDRAVIVDALERVLVAILGIAMQQRDATGTCRRSTCLRW